MSYHDRSSNVRFVTGAARQPHHLGRDRVLGFTPRLASDPGNKKRIMLPNDVPELAHFHDKPSRRSALRKAIGDVWRQERPSCQAVLVFLGAFAAAVFIMCSAPVPAQVGPPWPRLMFYGGVAIACAIVAARGVRVCGQRLRYSLRCQLESQGIPCCFVCGYNLTGNVSGVCSECGKEVLV